MELDLGPEIAQYRRKLREWIAAEAPEELVGLADWNAAVQHAHGDHSRPVRRVSRPGLRF